MRTLGVYNIKGGVGKTTAAVNLAYLAAKGGLRTLVWDLDPQGAASFYFRIKPKLKGGARKLLDKRRALDRLIKGTDFPALDLIPADFSHRNLDLLLDGLSKPRTRLRRLLDPLRDEYDLVLLDCPPGISLVSENIFRACAVLLLPTIPAMLSLRTYAQIARHFAREGIDAPQRIPFFSMVDRRRRLHREIMVSFAKTHPECARAYIPYASEVEQMGLRRMPVGAFARTSRGANAFAALWAEIERRLTGVESDV